MKRINSFDKKTGEDVSWYVCHGKEPQEIKREHLSCDCFWPCKHPTLKLTLQCKKCKKKVIEYV